MEKIFIQILNMSWTASLVIGLVFLIRLFFMRLPKIYSYLLWGVVGIRLLIPFSFESIWSLLPSGTEVIPQNIGMADTPQIQSGLPLVDHGINAVLPPAAPAASVNPMQIWLFFGEVVWIGGMVLLIGYSLFSVLRLKRKLRFSRCEEENIYLAEGLQTPFILGFFRPKIYLPTGLSADERAYILLHEQTHLRRQDHRVKLLAFFLVCVHWFNPLVWLAFVYMCRDMEMSCDEAVLRKLGNGIKKDYSASLFALASGAHQIKGSPLAFGEGEVKGRIKNILRYKRPTIWIGVLGGLAVLLLGLGLLANPNKSMKLLEADSVYVSEQLFSDAHMEAHAVSNGTKWIFQMQADELAQIIALQEFVQALRVEKRAVNQSRAEVREKDYQLIFYRDGTDGLAFYWNADCSEVWVDNGVKPSFTYRVVDAAKAKAFLDQFFHDQAENEWARKLLAEKTAYVGNHVQVGRILSLLQFPKDMKLTSGFELQTAKEPYGIILPFTVGATSLEPYRTYQAAENQQLLREKLYLLFALIDNVGEVRLQLSDGRSELELRVTRAEANEAKGEDIRNFTENIERFRTLLQGQAVAAKNDAAVQTEPYKIQTEQEILSYLRQFPQVYASEQAVRDGFFVQLRKNQILNHSVMEAFVQAAQAGKPAQMKSASYTIEGGAILHFLHFDGERFSVVSDYSRDGFHGGRGSDVRRYAHLYVLEDAWGRHMQVLLSDAEGLTYSQVAERLLDSGEPFDGFFIYSGEKLGG